MSAIRRSPRLTKGAIIGVDVYNPVASSVVFQYNPTTLTRRIRPRSSFGQSATFEGQRLAGPPEETIVTELFLDATDGLEDEHPVAVATGIAPQIAALEMLVHPKAIQVAMQYAKHQAGLIEFGTPTTSVFTLFAWGVQRIVPVRVEGMTITEEAFDPQLHPIRARVALNLRVLTFADFSTSQAGFWVSMAHSVLKEAEATVGSALNTVNLGSVLPYALPVDI